MTKKRFLPGVTENKYSQEKSTPGVLISQEINTPRYFFPRKFVPPTNNTLFPRKGAYPEKEDPLIPSLALNFVRELITHSF